MNERYVEESMGLVCPNTEQAPRDSNCRRQSSVQYFYNLKDKNKVDFLKRIQWQKKRISFLISVQGVTLSNDTLKEECCMEGESHVLTAKILCNLKILMLSQILCAYSICDRLQQAD